MDDVPDYAPLTSRQQKRRASQKPSKNGELTEAELSSEASTAGRPPPQLVVALAQGDNSSKASAVTKPPSRLVALARNGISSNASVATEPPPRQVALAKSDNLSKASAATKPPSRLADFVTGDVVIGDLVIKASTRRRLKFECATVLMERILDNKSAEAPTSVMSLETRATVLGGLIGLRWNDKPYGYLPIFVANGKIGAVRHCLKAGCNPGREGKARWAPIYNAIRGCSGKHLKCLRELVAYGADVNARRYTNGRTPLHYVVESKPWPGYSSVIHILLAAGADPNIGDGANDLLVLMLLVGNGPLSHEKRDALFLLLAPNFNTDLNVRVLGTRDNPLHLAIRRKDAYTVDALLEKMNQIGDSALDLMHEHNGSGFTPILLALTIFQLGEESDEELQIILYLLSRGANANDGDITNGKTPLHLIIGRSNNSIALQLLCRHSANPKLPDKSGQTAVALVENLRECYPQDRWYRFAARRITNRLTTNDYRPPALEAFLAEETENQRTLSSA